MKTSALISNAATTATDVQASIVATKPKDTLYYDGNCPMCSAEMCKLATLSSDDLDLQNIHELEDFDGIPDKHQLLARLHVKTASGRWLRGIDANVHAWSHTPYAAYWRVLALPVIRIFSCVAYELWLRMRQRTDKVRGGESDV